MRDPDAATLREFETWLSLLTDRSLPERHEWKAWFCVAEYERPDFQSVSAMLRRHGSTGSFAFLGRDATEQAEIIETLHADGHEIVFHSHRHHTYEDLSYEQAEDAITTGLSTIEDATGITPDGFFVPFFELSEGALRAIEDQGFDWILASPGRESDSVDVYEPVRPLDTKRFEDRSVSKAMAEFERVAESGGGPFLFHPPIVEYRNGMDAFEDWIRTVEPVAVGDGGGSDGPGVLLDCVRPVRVT